MTIKLFGHKKFGGNSIEIRNNVSNMKSTRLNYRASSMKLLENSDKVLLYKGVEWNGDVMWRHGVKHVNNLNNFNNKVKSMRILPFLVKVKYHVIYSGSDLPGPNDTGTGFWGELQDLADLANQIKDMHSIVHDIWKEYLVSFQMEEEIFWQDSKKFFSINLNRDEFQELKNESDINFPTDHINVVLVDDVRQSRIEGNALGVSSLEGLAAPVVVAEVRSKSVLFENARTIAHEIGHMFGLSHGKNSNSKRLMTQTGVVKKTGRVEDAVHLSRTEVETVHKNLGAHDAAAALIANNAYDLRKE